MTILQEKPITIPKAARLRKVNPSTAWRWALKGVRGVKLETFSVGVKRFTTEEALERFIEGCTNVANGVAPTTRTPAQRERDIQRAEAELERMGI